eukprot:CAMPEP_0178911982 /NCGR_PEP_ID=MMETSP0786-20121207/10001_1 /TAXON_ID=186022 /ORGANISM="Thalassionema frauenfeldii, Strain CCMP 1798" /LENGTH=374 /DNA_ID=CAMNT_0020584497 /DNA_START=194 /DNA_END=1318 /DNA_ORIENTATION=-
MNGESNKKSGLAAKLARPNILELKPYRCARDDYSEGVLLDANENALGPTSLPSNSLDPYDNHLLLERYPDPYQVKLKEKYAEYRGNGLSHENVFCGVGSDEAIDLLLRIFCKPGVDNILITPPTYGMYNVCAKVNDVEVVSCPLSESFDLRVSKTLETSNTQTKLLFICSPGNPTCKAIPLSDIEKVATSSQYEGIVVVDEAYVDFSEHGSAVSLVHKYPNVVVLQTLSKAFGLAGIRCGFAIGAKDVIQLMNNVKAPYNVNSLTSEVALNALNSIDTLKKNVTTLLEQRELLVKKLNSLDFVLKVFPSDSNFLLFRLKEKAKEVYTTMANNGVVVRFRGNELHCSECLRVTIGTEEENNKFLELLSKTYNGLI